MLIENIVAVLGERACFRTGSAGKLVKAKVISRRSERGGDHSSPLVHFVLPAIVCRSFQVRKVRDRVYQI